MYSRILVATGGSPWSDAAVAYAIALAAHLGAVLRIVTVLGVPQPVALIPEAMGGSELVLDTIESEAQGLVAQAAARAASAGVACKTFCPWGSVPETILRLATEERCDLIIVGTRGMMGLKRLMLGSTANAVAVKALHPVLVVKQSAVSTPPFGHRLLVATGGSPWSEAAVEHAVQLARALQLELCILHVERGWPHRGEDPGGSEGKHLLALAEERAAIANVAYEGVLASGSIPEAILATATQKQCHAIVLGSRGLTGWKRLMVGSIANAVTAKALQPVLLVKRFVGV
jgi:nucleotide-binding universal stress UspA family protein